MERIREAASAVLRLRDDERVYLVHRNPALRFFGDFWAFPGGAVHPSDRSAAASHVVGGDADSATYILCCAREAMEELGLDLATAGLGAVDRARLRAEVVASEDAYADWLREGGHRLEADRFRPFLRLLTPPFSPTRFDTQFLRLDLWRFPGAGTAVIESGELVDGGWELPGQWLARWRAGEILIAPPVLLVLEVLEQHGWEGAASALAQLEVGFVEGRIHPIFYNPAVQLMPLRTPTLPPATHTNAYLVGKDPAYLVDPATPHEEEQRRLLAALEEAESRGTRLEAILLTHHHTDHVGAVARVRRERRLPVWAHQETAELLAGQIPVDRLLSAGERLSLGDAPNGKPGWELEILHTPGHAPGHLCFFEREYGSLICGDMVSTISSILIHPSDGNMGHYLDSLRLLSELPARMLFPAHGPASGRPRDAFVSQLEHRGARQTAVQDAIAAGARRIREVVETVYGDIPSELHAFAADSVRSIVQLLREESWLEGEDGQLRPLNLD